MIDIDKLIFKVLLLDGNSSMLLERKSRTKFHTIIIELTKIKYDIRYCSNKNCGCHPESSIKILLEDKDLCKFLKDEHLFETISALIEDYEPIVAKGIYEN